MKKRKEEERDCCPDRFSASMDSGLGELTSYARGGWEGGGEWGELDWVDVGWMVDGGNMGRIGGKREAQ